MVENKLLEEVSIYYSQKLEKYGVTPKGVDWNGAESQSLRFLKLSELITTPTSFSLNDLGCGYGALYAFLSTRYDSFFYCGIDVSEKMVRAAKQRYLSKKDVRFIVSNFPDQIADYSIASGIFNVRLNWSDDEWMDYMKNTLDILNQSSRVGFAFNCLSTYSDVNKRRKNLYYADPCVLFDFCKRRYAPHVSLIHDYGLYEFTILIKKV